MKKKKIISFYANAESQGLRTVSLAFSNLLAQQNYSVLYVELDTNNPLISKALQIHTEGKDINSYFERTTQGEFASVKNYILSHEDIVANGDRKQKAIYQGIEKEVSFLVFPMDIKDVDVPDLIDYSGENVEEFVLDYVERFTSTLLEQEYDFIVCKLATDVDHMFTFEMMKHSDHIISVTTPSITKLMKQKDAKRFLFEQNKELRDKWHDVLNMASEEVPSSEYKSLLDTNCIIPFDPERQKEELALQPDSELIRQKLERLVLDLGIQIQVTVENQNSTLLQKVFSGRG